MQLRDWQWWQISEKLKHKSPENEFSRGIRHFGHLLLEVTLVFVLVIFVLNSLFLHKPILDSFLFALALAIGLTPSLLPAIISITLARGAKKMAKNKVIVKQLISIENFGSMNILR